MAYPTIVYNASTGSDTAASGAGPSTAVTGTNGDGASGTTFTLNETVDFTGAADDDSDVLWVNFTAGTRHLYRITAFNPSVGAATTLTVSETLPSQTGKSWAVGGKRKTLENDTSKPDLEDGLAGWTFELEDGTYTVTTTQDVSAGDATDGPVTIQAASGASPVVAISTTNHLLQLGAGAMMIIKGLQFNPANSRSAIRFGGAAEMHIEDCAFKLDGTGTQRSGISVANSWVGAAINCHFYGEPGGTDALSGGISFTNGRQFCKIAGCQFYDLGGNAIGIASVTALSMIAVEDSLFDDINGDGVAVASNGADHVVIAGNSFNDCKSDAISLDSVAETYHLTIRNNIFSRSGGYALNVPANAQWTVFADYNAFYLSTSGHRNNSFPAGANDVTLTADPYTDQANDDLSLNNTAGGGAACKAAGFPGAMKDGTNVGYRDIGALQVQLPSAKSVALINGGLLVQ